MPVLAALAAFLGVAGCETSGTFEVSGTVLLDGRPTMAELLFEPLNESGKRQGQPVTVVAGADGSFRAALTSSSETSPSVRCRIAVRVPRSTQEISSAFDYEALPDKVVELRRDLSPDQMLTLLITQ